jgi:N-acetylornithine carbamoyltransferase
MKHFLNTQDCTRPDMDALLARAAAFKRSRFGDELKGRSIALVFFNPSMRTRTSFELGAFQLGGQAIVLAAGQGCLADRVRPGHGDGWRQPRSTSPKWRACSAATST